MNFNQDERALLAQLADVLIPAGDGMPSASQANVSGQWLDAVLTARPDLAIGLRDVLGAARDRDATDVVADLRMNDPAAFGALAEIVSAAYFMNPDVRQATGYAGQGPRPIDPRPDYMEGGLLESVIRRGPIYRPTPDNTQQAFGAMIAELRDADGEDRVAPDIFAEQGFVAWRLVPFDAKHGRPVS